MINKKQIQELLNLSLSTGADFGEIFLENTINQVIRVNNGEVSAINNANIHGVGIRLLQGLDEVYGYTNDTSYGAILALLKSLLPSFSATPQKAKPLGDKKAFSIEEKIPYTKWSTKEKCDRLVELSNLMKSESPLVVQAMALLLETKQEVLVANTNGIYQDDVRLNVRVPLQAAVANEKGMYDMFEGPGRSCGLEIFDLIDLKAVAKDVVKSAITLLNADEMEAQVMPVVIHNGFGGVIFHEACGHPLESSSIAKGLGPFVGKVGQKVASDIVTAYDKGNIPGTWGSLNYDDEGNPTQDNLLIENGVLKSYLIDEKGARRMNTKSTGSGRRQSYKFAPTSRMNTTYIAPGKDKYEDIIKDTKYGLFAKKLGGGSVQPATGEFNFVVLEGYMIENGKITKPVKGATLIGQGGDVLFKIDKVADNLELGQGMCGASSGALPTDVGQPTIRVSAMTVGGAGGKTNV